MLYEKDFFMSILMPNHTTNQIKRSLAEDDIIKDIRNPFRWEKKKDNGIEDRVLRNIRTLFESDAKDYYKMCYYYICSAFDNNYNEYESNGGKDKTLSVGEYLDKIRQYLSNIINDLKSQWEWKIQLTIAINFISSKDSKGTRTMQIYSDNIEIMIGNETDEIITGNETDEIVIKLFNFLLQKYQERLEERMRGSEFVFDSVDILCYKLYKIRLSRGRSYKDSPKNNDGKWF